MTTTSLGHVLDRAAWESLTGPHARFAQRNGRAVRYRPDTAGFVALEDPGDPRAWDDAAELLAPGERLSLRGAAHWPAGWQPVLTGTSVQMVASALRPRPEPEAVLLGRDDVPEMLDLVARTRPGPFLPRTIELGTYLGIRRDGRLAAMAGERLHPAGWTEISAVCTDPAYRGQGLAGRLVRAVAAGIVARGETPFLHARGDNAEAIALYARLGFALRLTSTFTVLSRLGRASAPAGARRRTRAPGNSPGRGTGLTRADDPAQTEIMDQGPLTTRGHIDFGRVWSCSCC